MANCAICGAPTLLHVNDIPVCLTCEKKQQAAPSDRKKPVLGDKPENPAQSRCS